MIRHAKTGEWATGDRHRPWHLDQQFGKQWNKLPHLYNHLKSLRKQQAWHQFRYQFPYDYDEIEIVEVESKITRVFKPEDLMELP